MNVNWRAAAIGGVVFWVLAYVFGYLGGLAGFGNVLAALIGGFVGVWQARSKTSSDAAMLGAVAGIIGGVIAIILSYVGLSYGTWMISLGSVWAEWIVWGLVFAAIGGAVGSLVKMK